MGCPRNLVDSEVILGNLKNKGYKITDVQAADIAIVNTCCFIKEAKEESIETILELADLKTQGKIKKLIVSGCLPQRYKKELIPHLKEVDAFVGRLSLENFPKERYNLVPKHFAYLKISEGCNNNCSYCVIPRIKGRFSSRPIEDILEEVKSMDKNNTKEINIIGQDVTSYGVDIYKKPFLVRLLKKIISETNNIKWIRLLYTYPNHIDDELIELIAENRKICKYLDLPIQHVNNRILKLMGRKITKERITSLIKKIRNRIPGIAIRTSFIVGFPSETEEEFQELLDFVGQTKFERLGVFMYSREEDTPAYNFNNQVPQRIKEERLHRLMTMQQVIAQETNSKYLNREIEVLIDEKDPKENLFLARTEADAPEVDGMVYVHSIDRLNPGDFVKVKIKDTYEYDLVADKV